MSGRRPLKNITKADMLTFWDRVEIPLTTVARSLGTTSQALSMKAKRLGLPSRRSVKKSQRPSDEAFRRMWFAHVDGNEIVKACRYKTRARLDQRRLQLGLPTRTRAGGGNNGWQTITLAEYHEIELARLMQASPL